jgi:dihydroorotate dehydrogenase
MPPIFLYLDNLINKKEKEMFRLGRGGDVFGPIFCATGSQGFFGEGYPFHRYWRYAGMTWQGVGLAGKTLTVDSRRGKEFGEAGNMPLQKDGTTPVELFPKSIWVDFRQGGEMMNAVGLSNFGAAFYLRTGRYHQIRRPFFISVMLVAEDPSGRQAELREFCQLLRRYLPFTAPVALQMNFDCPNSGHNPSEFHAEICGLIAQAKADLALPVVINTNALMPTAVFLEAARVADALWIGNTIPFGDQAASQDIDWSRFGTISPLHKRGIAADGGLSSPRCLSLTIRKVRELRASGITKPIVGGNGIRTLEDLDLLYRAGCDAVFVGSLAVLKPWRMPSIIRGAHELFT